MRERSDWIWFGIAAAALGGWAGYHYFAPLMKFLCVGAFPTFVWFFSNAAKLARISFSIASGLALACVSIGTLMAQRFAKRSRYDRIFPKVLLIALVGFGVAGFYYRYEMTLLGAGTTEFLRLLTDSKRHLVLNPLTKIALASSLGSLTYGFLKGTIDYSSSGR